HPDGFLADHITRAVYGIDADVHHGAASGKLFVQPPLVGVADAEAAQTLEEQHLAEFTGVSHADDLKRIRLKMHSIADQEFDVGCTAGIDHLLSFFGVDGHRLFTDHVFACACYANRLVFVKAIRCDDV